MERTINRFYKGAIQADRDSHLADPNGYIYALCGRISFNEPNVLGDENTITDRGGSAMLAFVNEKGTKQVHTFCGDLQPVGHLDFGDSCIVWLTDGTTSEIGVFTVNPSSDTVAYTTLFNDDNDPNGERLGLSLDYRYRVSADMEKESDGRKRVYWTDDKGEPCCLNIDLCYDSAGDPLHQPQNCTGPYDPYPWWFSVHSMRLRPDVGAAQIVPADYDTSGGGLKSGVYRVTFQYQTRDGHLSHWHPTTPKIFVSNVDVQGPYLDVAMTESNIRTESRIRWTITGLDTRFWKVRVAFQYAINSTDIFESFIFHEEELDPATHPGGSTTFWLDYHGGTPIGKETFITDYEWFKSAPDLAVFRSKLIVAGPQVMTQPELDTSTVTITPITKQVVNDEITKNDIIDPLSPTNENFPFDTNPMMDVSFFSGNYQVQLYEDSGGAPVYKNLAAEEYPNYKGPVFAGYFPGYFRGETYPFGCLLFDRKMRPLYVIDLIDFTFPNQYDTGFELTEYDAGSSTYRVKILGAQVSGLRIPETVLYDENGELQIAAFAIVRCKRKPRIKYQGVIANTVWDKIEATVNDYTYAHPYIISDYFQNPGPPNASLNIIYDTNVESEHGSGNRWFARPNTFMFYSPDVMIEQSFGDISKDDYVKIVATAIHDVPNYGETVADWAPYLFPVPVGGPDWNVHAWGKFYKTNTLDLRNIISRRFRINKASLVSEYESDGASSLLTITDYDPDNLLLEFDPLIQIRANEPDYGNGHIKGAASARYSVLLKSKDLSLADVSDIANNIYYSYHLANLEGPQTSYYDTDTQSSRLYISTGHFQPINATVLADVPTVVVDGVTNYEFNEVEVWGGDCYATFWDFTPQCPWYWADCDTEVDGTYKDYSYSMIVPIESKYNIDMRYGRRFCKDAIFPEAEACGGTAFSGIYYQGVNKDQQPDWNVNSALQYEETLRFYPNKPPALEVITDMSNAIYYSIQKTSGELSDAYRLFLPNNYGLVEGVHGNITSLHRVFDGLYCLQERGLSALRINVRTAIATSIGELVTGTGKDFDGADYITTKYGCQHRIGATTMNNSLYFPDARMRAFCRHSGSGFEKISDTRGFHSLSWLNLIGFEFLSGQFTNVQAIPDYRNNEILFSLQLDLFELNLTFAFNEDLNALVTRYPYQPDLLISQGKYTLSAKGQNLHLHQAGKYGQYYGTYYSSLLRFVVTAQSPDIQKVFDVGNLNVNPDGVVRIGPVRLKTESQSQSLDLRTDPRMRFRNAAMRFPLMEIGERDRLRGQMLEVEIEITNGDQATDGDDIRVVLTSFGTDYRIDFKR